MNNHSYDLDAFLLSAQQKTLGELSAEIVKVESTMARLGDMAPDRVLQTEKFYLSALVDMYRVRSYHPQTQ